MNNQNETNTISEEKRIHKLGVLLLTLILSCFFGAMAIFFMYEKIQLLEKQNSELKVELTKTEAELYRIENELTNAKNELSEEKALTSKMSTTLIDALDQNIFFDECAGIVTTTGDKYHTYDCYHWHNGNPIYIYNVELAAFKGYQPCLDCH